ncbi:MAG: hypothetical protein ABS76_26170 [Pelagibacterium sp. SCN 64-44]|nr:MAG: hypothetical protein ABS76_26170 [Pelagibacterium sp. SCN 64-44]
MVAVTAASPYSPYAGYTASGAGASKTGTATAQQAQAGAESAATSVTLSEAARAAMAERDFTAVLADTRAKLKALLEEAGRTSPLKDGRLALDLSSLDQRELYAMSSDDTFTPDEREAAGLEMQRRFEAALSGPAAIARVTGNYTALYKSAATYLDGLGAEERATAEWKAGRDAVAEGLRQLQAKPGTRPDLGPNDPVALYLALSETAETPATSMPDLAANARTTLDRLYAEAQANGKAPTFNRASSTGQYIDVSGFSSRALSSIVLDKDGQFTAEETRAARTVLQSRSGATLLAGFQSASKSGDPTAFSQNIINAFSSLSAEERQAVGWSDQLYQTAMQSYVTTSKLMDMFSQVTSGSANNGGLNLATLLGGQ